MAGEDGHRAIELLGENDAGKPMGQGHGPERQLEIGAGEHLWRKPLSAAHQKGEAGRAVIAKFAEGLRELGAAELRALAIETNKFVCGRYLAEHHHGFGGGAGGRALDPAT